MWNPWEWLKWFYESLGYKQPIASAAGFVLVFALLGLVVWWRLDTQYKKDHPTGSAAPQADAPTILVRYTQQELPIAIPPHSSALVLQLTPHIQDQTMEVGNDGERQIYWPTEKPRDPNKDPLVGYAYVCELSNHSNRAFLDVAMLFDLKFISAVPVKAWMTHNPDGTNSISVHMDTTRKDDPMSLAFVDSKKRVIAATSGKLVSEHRHRVTIPVIQAQSTVTVYFVSQSALFSQFALPNTATLVVDGNPTHRVGALIRPVMNPTDGLGKWGLWPSVHEWPGVPDSSLNLDAFIALR